MPAHWEKEALDALFSDDAAELTRVLTANPEHNGVKVEKRLCGSQGLYTTRTFSLCYYGRQQLKPPLYWKQGLDYEEAFMDDGDSLLDIAVHLNKSPALLQALHEAGAVAGRASSAEQRPEQPPGAPGTAVGERWCKTGQCVFREQQCPQQHAAFMYTANLAAKAAPTEGASPPPPPAHPDKKTEAAIEAAAETTATDAATPEATAIDAVTAEGAAAKAAATDEAAATAAGKAAVKTAAETAESETEAAALAVTATAEADEVEVELLTPDARCCWLRGALPPAEQVCLFEFLRARDRTDWDRLPPCMNPSPKTLQLAHAPDDDGGAAAAPTLVFERGDATTAASEAVGRVAEVLRRREWRPLAGRDLVPADEPVSFSLAAIRYPSPDGRFPPHVDHCNDGSLVFLFSLGCAANFRVRSPAMVRFREVEMQSGDALVFDPSSEAAITHEVGAIGHEESCPLGLGGRFAELQRHRYGVQCRVRFG